MIHGIRVTTEREVGKMKSLAIGGGGKASEREGRVGGVFLSNNVVCKRKRKSLGKRKYSFKRIFSQKGGGGVPERKKKGWKKKPHRRGKKCCGTERGY